MYDAAEGEDKKILERVLRKYGAYKLELQLNEKLNIVIHTGRGDMYSHYVGAPRYACSDLFSEWT